MKRSPAVQTARNALRDPDNGYVQFILNSVNLTLLEREIVTRSEIDGEKTEKLSLSLKNWTNKDLACSYSNCIKIKKKAMLKIYEFLISIKNRQ